MTSLAPERGGGVERLHREPWASRRVAQLVEDVIRTYPEGAPREVLLQRLARVGVTRAESADLLAMLMERRRIRLSGERYMLAGA